VRFLLVSAGVFVAKEKLKIRIIIDITDEHEPRPALINQFAASHAFTIHITKLLQNKEQNFQDESKSYFFLNDYIGC
jgi:hypothetical protein